MYPQASNFSRTPLNIVHSASHKHLTQSSIIKRLAVPSIKGVSTINFNDIVFLQAQCNYTMIHSIDGKTKCYSRVLKQVIPLIDDPNFLRVHQSFYINTQHIKSFCRTSGYYKCTMTNNMVVPVSRRKRKEFNNWLIEQIKI